MATSTTALHWFRKYSDLAPRQRDFVDKYEGDSTANVLLQGPPGSGKTILLVNLINKLREKHPTRKIGLVTYTRSLIDMLNTGLDASGVQAVTYFDFKKNPNIRYDLLVVDEVQDLPADILQAIRNQATQVVVAGDTNQQIFSHGCTEANTLTYLRLSPEERFNIALSYRLTPSVFQAARVFKPNVLAPTESNGKTDVKPEIAKAVSWAQEVEYVYLRARLSPQQGDVSAILFPSRNSLENFANAVLQYEGKPVWILTKNRFNEPDYGQLNAHLAQHDIALEVVQNSYGSLDSVVRNKRVVLQTYHSAKGLDYHSVCLPGLNSNEFISSPADTLLYVALTRSRANMCLSYSGEPHAVVRRIEHLCASIAADPKRIPRSGPSVGFTSDDF
jgi:superfamily I DNA/RNA helicase